MRILFVLAILFFSLNSVFSQKKSNPLFFNEITLSVNRTMIDNSNSEGKFGFGAGLYRTWMDSSWFNLVTGISYNKTSQFRNSAFIGSHFSSVSDITFNIHSVSIPVLLRFNVGQKTKLFFEIGQFLEFDIAGNSHATYTTQLPYSASTTITIKEKLSLTPINGGFIGGIGTNIPIGKIRLLIKADYQFAFAGHHFGEETILNRYVRLSIGLRKL